MISFEDIKDYLPKYLTPESEKTLFEELKSFPENIDSRIYTNYLKDENIIFQGDGIEGLLFVNLPAERIEKVSAMILSNMCDTNPENVRLFHPNIVYSPIINLKQSTTEKVKGGIHFTQPNTTYGILKVFSAQIWCNLLFLLFI